jgi:hypothetical protein
LKGFAAIEVVVRLWRPSAAMRASLWCAAFLLAACSGPQNSRGDDAPVCSDDPEIVFDYADDVPDAGTTAQTAIEVPRLATSSSDLYVLLNWNTTTSDQSSRPRPGSTLPPVNQAANWQTILLRRSFAGRTHDRVPIPEGSAPASALATSSAMAAVAQAPPAGESKGAIWLIQNSDSEPQKLTESDGKVSSLFIDASSVYFADAAGTQSISVDGGAVRVLSPRIASSIVVADETLYLSVVGDGVYSLPLDGGDETKFDDDIEARELQACGADLCWLSGPALSGRIVRRPPDATPRVVTGELLEAHEFVSDAQNFFVTVGGFGAALLRAPSGGGASSVVWSGGATSVAASSRCLYWSTLNLVFGMSVTAADRK